MKRNDSIIDEVVSTIDDLNDVVTESKLDVIGSLVDSYDKILTLAEEDVDYDITKYTNMFSESYEMDYYQEAKQQEKSFGEKFKERFDEGNILWSIIKFIPNLFKLIIDKISSLWKKEDESKAKKATEAFKKAGEGVKSVVSKIFDIIIDENGQVKTGFKIGGIAVSTTTLVVFVAVAMKYGKTIAKKFKEFWTGKVPAFFTRRENPNSIPKPEAVGKIRYKNNEWIMHINLPAIVEFFNGPQKLIHEVGQLTTYDENALKTFKECTAAIIEARKLDIASTKEFNYTDEQIDHWISTYNDNVNGLKDSAAASLNNLTALLNSIQNKGTEQPAGGEQTDGKQKQKKPKLDKNEKEAVAVIDKCVKELTAYVGIIPPLMKFAKEGVIEPLTRIMSLIQVSSGNLSVPEGIKLYKQYCPDATDEEIKELEERLNEKASKNNPAEIDDTESEDGTADADAEEQGEELTDDRITPTPAKDTTGSIDAKTKKMSVKTKNDEENKGNPVKNAAGKTKDAITGAAHKVAEGARKLFKKKDKNDDNNSGNPTPDVTAEYVVSYASENGFTKEETLELFAECSRLYGSLLFGDQEFQEAYVEENFYESDGYADDCNEDEATLAWYNR